MPAHRLAPRDTLSDDAGPSSDAMPLMGEQQTGSFLASLGSAVGPDGDPGALQVLDVHPSSRDAMQSGRGLGDSDPMLGGVIRTRCTRHTHHSCCSCVHVRQGGTVGVW